MGLLHVGVYTLLLLSGERAFAVRLNTVFEDSSIVFDFPAFSGNYADLVVLVPLRSGSLLFLGSNPPPPNILSCPLPPLSPCPTPDGGA